MRFFASLVTTGPRSAVGSSAPHKQSVQKAPWVHRHGVCSRAWSEYTQVQTHLYLLPKFGSSFEATSTRSSSHARVSPTITPVERAMHRWPAAPNAAPARAAIVCSRSASGRMTPVARGRSFVYRPMRNKMNSGECTVVLRAEVSLAALAVAGGAGVDEVADWVGANERDRTDVRVVAVMTSWRRVSTKPQE